MTGNKDADKIVEKILAEGRKVALPDESFEMIKLFGIDVPDYAIVKTAEEAVRLSQAIGFPVVLKIASPDVIHKSDMGGVVTGLNNVQDVEKSYNKIINNLKNNISDVRVAGILVQKQMPETTHLIIGGLHDDQFGPAVMFGLGGVFVELFKDVSFRIAPVNEAEASEMVKEIKAYPVLSGYRGSQRVDIKKLTKTIINISELITNISIISEIELNPLFGYEESIIAVDARMILR